MIPREMPLQPRSSLLQVLKGKARVVGARTTVGRYDLGLPPGMISPYELRIALGLRYGDPPIEEARYERDRSLKKDLSLLLRFGLSRVLRQDQKEAPKNRTWIVSAPIDPIDTSLAIDKILCFLRQKSSALVFFVHPHALNLAANDPSLQHTLAQADLILPDGIGIRIAASILGLNLPANVNGTDLIPELLVQLAAERIPIALIGGRPGVAQAAAQYWSKSTAVEVLGTWDGFQSDRQYEQIASNLEQKSPCVLLVGLGSPLQEKFASKFFLKRPGVVTITVGGLFDFASQSVARAPLAWRELGLEWLWRLVQEPKRLGKRYLVGNPLFLLRAAKQRGKL